MRHNTALLLALLATHPTPQAPPWPADVDWEAQRDHRWRRWFNAGLGDLCKVPAPPALPNTTWRPRSSGSAAKRRWKRAVRSGAHTNRPRR